jgi:pilus assembly protein CpaD
MAQPPAYENPCMSMKPYRHPSRWAPLLALLAAGALGGCGADYVADNAPLVADYHAQHPIVLAEAPTTLDIYPVGEGLDARSLASIRGFAERYRALGTGRIAILTPAGHGVRNARVVDQIRRALAASGLRGYVGVGVYPVAYAASAAPVRLVFRGLKAEVLTPCGQWPTDLASGSSLEGWRNEAYPNFGCATQSVLAAEVADPRDLVQAHPTDPSDVAMRMRAIGDVRNGQDPGTQWANKLTTIGQVGN